MVAQHPIPPIADPSTASRPAPVPASLAYATRHDTNPSPFLLAPILNLPPSFGSAYVGETFSCTLCANHEAVETAAGLPPSPAQPPGGADASPTQPPPPPAPPVKKFIRDVRIEAEMKTPSTGNAVTKLNLSPAAAAAAPIPAESEGGKGGGGGGGGGVDLDPGATLQRIVHFDLKDEGNHVLGVTVSYYEATETSGRTRTFRKLYQFICKPSLIVRTKAGPLAPLRAQPTPPPEGEGDEKAGASGSRRRWILEAQLENCSEETMELERVALELEEGLGSRDCNWESSGSARPVLHPAEVEQVCFVIEEKNDKAAKVEEGRILFGTLGIGWRGEMGSRGYLATGKLGTRHI